jgi:hypothetical protein
MFILGWVRIATVRDEGLGKIYSKIILLFTQCVLLSCKKLLVLWPYYSVVITGNTKTEKIGYVVFKLNTHGSAGILGNSEIGWC